MNYSKEEYDTIMLVNHILNYIRFVEGSLEHNDSINHVKELNTGDDIIFQITNSKSYYDKKYNLIIEYIIGEIRKKERMSHIVCLKSFSYLRDESYFIDYLKKNNIILANTDNLRGEDNTKIWIDFLMYFFRPYDDLVSDDYKTHTINEIINKLDKVFPGIIFGG